MSIAEVLVGEGTIPVVGEMEGCGGGCEGGVAMVVEGEVGGERTVVPRTELLFQSKMAMMCYLGMSRTL